MIRKATCCCGQCAVTVEGEPAINAICHCSNCKKRTGSAFGWSVYFADGQVSGKEGDLRLYAIGGAKSQRRWFCGSCGTTLLWKIDALPHLTGIAGGCFVETPLAEPSYTVSNDGRCAWVTLPANWRRSLDPKEFGRAS
jgi:hypothetical protein